MTAPLGAGYRVAVAVLRPLLIVLTRRDWRGAENLPTTGGFVVAPNHLSHVDPIIIAHFLYDHGRPARFLTKSGLFTIPVVGWVVRTAGQIPVYRESHNAAAAFAGAVAAVEAGECVAIYPEGTLTRDPDLWPMTSKTGAARVALTTGCPVIPIAQWGAQEILRPYTKRPHLLGRKVIHVTAGPPVDLDDLRGQPLTTELLRAATERIMQRVTEQLAVVRGEDPPAKVFDVRAAGLSRTGKPELVAGPRDARPTDVANPSSTGVADPSAGRTPGTSPTASPDVPSTGELSAEGFSQ